MSLQSTVGLTPMRSSERLSLYLQNFNSATLRPLLLGLWLSFAAVAVKTRNGTSDAKIGKNYSRKPINALAKKWASKLFWVLCEWLISFRTSYNLTCIRESSYTSRKSTRSRALIKIMTKSSLKTKMHLLAKRVVEFKLSSLSRDFSRKMSSVRSSGCWDSSTQILTQQMGSFSERLQGIGTPKVIKRGLMR